MIKNDSGNVSSAFEILLEEVDAEIEFVNAAGGKAFADREYDRASQVLEYARRVTAFRARVADLQAEWLEVANGSGIEEDMALATDRQNLGRLPRGERTPEIKFREPILRVLADMGGTGNISEVLERVHGIVKSDLKEVDYEPLKSSPDTPRWRNTAQWARLWMVRQGWLRDDSPHGVWDITVAGREALRRGDATS